MPFSDPGLDFYVDYLTIGALLTVLLARATAVQGVPAVDDFNFLPNTSEGHRPV